MNAPHRHRLEVPKGCWLRNPAGAPLDGRIVDILYDRDPMLTRREQDPEPKVLSVTVAIQRPSPNGPLMVEAVGSPVHLAGRWTFHLDTYPANPSWPPLGRLPRAPK